jgi:hypothetical protein
MERLFLPQISYSGYFNDRLGVVSNGDKKEEMGADHRRHTGLFRVYCHLDHYRLLDDKLRSDNQERWGIRISFKKRLYLCCKRSFSFSTI